MSFLAASPFPEKGEWCGVGTHTPIFARDLHERLPDSRTTEMVARPVEGLQSA